MEKSFKRRVIKTIITISASFALLVFLAFIAINSWLPDYLLKKYISRSRELAQVLSRSLEGHNINSPQEHIVRRMVQLNFPEERNFVHIVIRDTTGTPMYVEKGENEGQALSEMLDHKREGIKELADDGPSRVVQYQERDIMYYTITTPIVQNGKKTGDVVVGFSKKYLTDRIELNRSQVTQLVFISSFAFIVLLILSFFFILRLFIKFKKSEELADSFKRMAYVGELSSGLAHEIRNPLNLMSINLQLLREGLENGQLDRVKKKIEILESAKNHAARILDEFLGFSRMRIKGREAFDLVGLLEETQNLASDEAKARGAVLISTSDPKTIMIRADRAEMRQIILNLVINALDAVTRTEKKEIQVHLTIKKSEICLTVSDTGSGMDEFTVNNMYTPFFSKKQGGTGLGLAVVRRIVEEYSGEIECRSRPGEGTTFTITLKGILIS